MKKLKIISIKKISKKHHVYDLNVSGNHNFFITEKNILTHNCDYSNALTFQPALRNFMEEFSKNCGFIATCNYKSKIIEPLRNSRFKEVDFIISKEELPKLASQIFERVCYILKEEGVPYEKKVVAEFVKKYFPDNRRIINELQFYAKSGNIDSGILSINNDVSIKSLIGFLKEKNFTEVRKWVSQNFSNDPSIIFRKIYDNSCEFVDKSNIPGLILILADYQYKSAFVADQEINMTACLVEIMANCF